MSIIGKYVFRITVGVFVDVGVGVGVMVDVGVLVGVFVGVFVDVGVGVGVMVDVGVLVGVSVDVGVGVLVAVGVTVGVAVGVKVGSCTPSNAPMSQCGPRGRVKPRWSRLLTGAAAQIASFAVSIAALPGPSAIVWVGPPLFCRGPSTGLLLMPGHAVSG